MPGLANLKPGNTMVRLGRYDAEPAGEEPSTPTVGPGA
jgi:hypothetical protein